MSEPKVQLEWRQGPDDRGVYDAAIDCRIDSEPCDDETIFQLDECEMLPAITLDDDDDELLLNWVFDLIESADMEGGVA